MTQEEIDELWKVEVERRINEVRTGKVKTIPGEKVFEEILRKFDTKRKKLRPNPNEKEGKT